MDVKAKKDAFSGTLDTKPLEAILFQMASKKMDGEIRLENGASKRTLYVRKGEIVFSSSSTDSENFLAFLVQREVVPAEVAQKRKAAGARAAIEGLDLFGENPPIAKGLKDLGKEFTLARTVDCFAWQKAQFRIASLNAALQKIDLLPLDAAAAISQGISQHYGMELLGERFSKLQGRGVLLTPEFRERIGQLHLNASELDFVKTIDGKKNLEQLLTGSSLNPLSAFRLLWVLFSLHMVGLALSAEALQAREDKRKEAEKKVVRQTSTPAPVQEEKLDPKVVRNEILQLAKTFQKINYFELLAIDRKATTQRIRDAYMRRAKQFHPDVITSLGLMDLTQQASAIFARMTEAQATLSDPNKRKEYEAGLDMDPNLVAKMNNIVRAETEFLKGELMLQNRSYDAALKQFQMALDLNPDEAEHHVYLAWTQFLTNRTDKDTAARHARQAIEKALRMRANMAMAHVFLGRIAKAQGDLTEAQKCFFKTLEISPEHEQAQAELRALEKMK